MKRIFFIVFLFSLCFYSKLNANEQDDQIIHAMLLNNLNYSVAVIRHYENKIILEQEYDNIINKIDKSKLKDNNTVAVYSALLDTLTNLKLQENKKLFIKQLAEKEKSETLYKSLSGTAVSATASLYQLGKGAAKHDIGSILGGVTSFVYTGVSVFFNYRDTVNFVENNYSKEMFEIDQATLGIIDNIRRLLFEKSTELINKYNIPKQYDIQETPMDWLVATLDSNDADAKVRLLEDKKETYRIFTPFWYELGAAYQKTGNINKAKECYAEFERQKSKYSIIDNDSYYTELAKNMIQIAKDEKDTKTIRKYLSIIEKDKTVANQADNRLFVAGVYLSLGDFEKAQEPLKLMMSETSSNYRKYVPQARELYQYIDVLKSSDSVYKKILANLKIADTTTVKKAVEYKKGDLSTFKNALNFFLGSEEEKVIYYDKLVFSLPEIIGKDYSLGIVINEKYYDSLDFVVEEQNEHYYFINYKLSNFIENLKAFQIILNEKSGEELSLSFDCSYLDSSDLKKISKAFSKMSSNKNNSEIDIADILQIDIGSFVTDLEMLSKDSSYKKDSKDTQTEKIISKYNKAKNVLFDSRPYKYKNHIVLKTKSYLFSYGVTKITTKDKQYSISKFGELNSPVTKTNELTDSLKTIYEKALLGDDEAEYNLGMAYLNGENIVIDYIEAIKWLKLSAQKNNMKALYQLGECFANALGVEKDKNRANYYYGKSAELGHQKAKEKLSK